LQFFLKTKNKAEKRITPVISPDFAPYGVKIRPVWQKNRSPSSHFQM